VTSMFPRLPVAAHDLDARFQQTCRDRLSALAIRNLSDGQSLTFADLLARYEAACRTLAALNIGPGMTVVIRVGNHPCFFSLFAACLHAGAALVPLGEATDDEAAAVISNCRAAALVTDRTLPPACRQILPLGAGVRIASLATDRDREVREASVVLKLTSGSTALPRAAVAGVPQMMADGRHVVDAMGIGPDDVNFACIPLSHSYALGNIVMPLLLQGAGVALRPSFNPSRFVSDVTSSAATVFPGVPFMFDRFRTQGLEQLPRSLRLLITAGAPIDPATVTWFRRRLGRKIHSFYGSSETGGIAYDDSDEVTDPIDVGRPMPETTIEIRQLDGEGRGRIFVRGTAVAGSYAGDDVDPVAPAVGDADDRAGGFVDGGFLTGDLGYLDGSGRLVLTERLSASVNVAGLKVNPREIEGVLRDLPGVADVRVMGASCDRRGQMLVAFVVSDQVLTPVELRRRCARRLSPHKIPRRFIFLERFPLDERGKMDRRALEALVADAST
jgi:acyl-CoA synthetase (AMP-forming)/AMP-acid ligase II